MDPKIAVLTKSLSRSAGGLFTSVRRLSQSVCKSGRVEVNVFGLRDQFTAQDISNWAPLTTHIFEPIGPSSFGYAPAFKRTLLQAGCNVAHVHGLWTYPSLACLSWYAATKSPYVISPRGMMDPWAIANSRAKKRLAGWLFEKRSLKNASCLHALCRSEAESIRRYGLKNPIAIIPNGIDVPSPGELMTPRSGAPWKSLVGDGRKVLLFLSRIHPKKGLPALLRAWHAAQLQDWALVIAGWDQSGHEEELKRLATELGIAWKDSRDGQQTFPSGSLLFVGPQFGIDKSACYASCDAFILPSHSEGLPMAVLEAWAYGKPVLMTEQCNLPEGFAAEAARCISCDTDNIAAALGELAALPKTEREQIGQRGRELVEGSYSWSQIARDMLEVYRWILGDGPRPSCVEM